MLLHQALSFSRPLMHIPHSEAIFWPGCALLMLDREILEETMQVLRRADPDIRLAAGCCGQPTRHLLPEEEQRRTALLTDRLRRQGVRRIYTACPNCTLQMGELNGFEVIPVWPVLAAHCTAADLSKHEGSFVWHDPCPTRQDPVQLEAVRKLLNTSGCDWIEANRSGSTSLCCGNFRMLHISDPERSQKVRSRCLAEMDERRTILSCCEGCLSSFRTNGRQTMHLLELLFGTSATRGWKNRILTTILCNKKEKL